MARTVSYFPVLQIWRAVVSTSIAKSVLAHFQLRTDNANSVYEYTPSSPLPFREGDFLGIFQPGSNTSRLRVHYIDNVGPPNYYYGPDDFNQTLNVNTPPIDVFRITSSTSTQNDQPLVAVEVSLFSLVTCDSTRPSVLFTNYLMNNGFFLLLQIQLVRVELYQWICYKISC